MSLGISYRNLDFLKLQWWKKNIYQSATFKKLPLRHPWRDKTLFHSSLYELTEPLYFFSMPFMLFSTGFVYFPLFISQFSSWFCSSSGLNASVCFGSFLSFPVGLHLSRYILPIIVLIFIVMNGCVFLTSTFMTCSTSFEVSSSLAADVLGCERRWHTFRKI